MKVRSIDRDLRELFAANFYKIPRFQRPYSWERENVDEFWSDTVADRKPGQDYFIGSMVVYPDQNGSINIVDGQQRLTTITIALCAIRDIFAQEGLDQLALGIQGLIEKTNINNEKQFVLNTESSYPFFQTRVLKFPESSSLDLEVGPEELNIQMAYEAIKAYVKELIADIKRNQSLSEESRKAQIEKRLIGVRDKMLSLKLILVELTDEDDAYVIFETLNTRGKDLAVSDLLRNFFTRHLRPANPQTDTAKLQWQNVLRTINESSADLSVDTYLHHHWLSKYSYVTLKELFKTIKAVIRTDKIQAFLDELERDSKYYREIHETSYAQWTQQERDIENALKSFQLFRVRQQTPFVLTLMRDYRTGKLRIKQIAPVLKALENFHFLFNAVTQSRSSGGISKMFVSSAIQLDQAADSNRKQQVIRELISKLRERIPQYEEFKIKFREILYTNTLTKNRILVRYILSKFDAHARRGVVVDYEAMTIEHLYPQRPQGEPLPDEVLGMLGNLILVSDELNRKLANKSFAEKVRILRQDSFPLDEILADAKTFDEETIGKRTDYRAEEAYHTIWKI